MKTYETKYFNRGVQVVMSDLEKGVPIKESAFLDLLNNVLSARGEVTEQTVHRDDNL